MAANIIYFTGTFSVVGRLDFFLCVNNKYEIKMKYVKIAAIYNGCDPDGYLLKKNQAFICKM